MKSTLKDIRTPLISYFTLKLTDSTRIAKRPILSLLQIRGARPTEKGLIRHKQTIALSLDAVFTSRTGLLGRRGIRWEHRET
jgi:hypothetical protein